MFAGFLLSLVVWLLASERRRAMQLARAMTLERDRASQSRARQVGIGGQATSLGQAVKATAETAGPPPTMTNGS